MKDSRIEKLSQILIEHSLDLQAGQTVLISSGELGKPLVLSLYERAIKKGAHPITDVRLDEIESIFYRYASPEQLDFFPKISMYQARNIDCAIFIVAQSNRRNLAGADPKKISRRSKALEPISRTIMDKVRWVLVNFPTNAMAQEAGMSIEDYEEFCFKATNIDWPKKEKEMKALKKALDKAERVRIEGERTDLSFSIKGRPSILCAGHANMPDGEVFTSPVENSADGEIFYDVPTIFKGQEVCGIRLVFRKGKVVEAEAAKGGKALEAALETDAGARRIGEFGVGTNYAIRQPTKDILFDEKIGGTVHLALGRSYTEAGGKVKSAIHWDMIKDLRGGGAIYLDGRPIQKDGKFLF